MEQNILNYCAGPAVLPNEVTERLIRAIENFDNTGISLLSLSHRDERFIEIAHKAKSLLKSLLSIPDNYHILFFHGGATTQFSTIALNLKSKNKALYLDCGYWSKLSIYEASKLIETEIIEQPYEKLFLEQSFDVSSTYDYVHYVDNETIDGREFQYIPDSYDIPLVCDMSSNLLSRNFDISRYGLVYAGAQKNIGVPGLSVVIIRDDLVKKHNHLPIVQSYYDAANKNSLSNTPVVMAWYTTYLILQWVQNNGGIEKFEQLNKLKSEAFYQYLDQSELFKPLVESRIRSRMNVVFNRKDQDALKVQKLIDQAEKDGFYGINGHRSIGGFRVSLYNAISLDETYALIDYLKEYEKYDR